jgi:hypothetical protein
VRSWTGTLPTLALAFVLLAGCSTPDEPAPGEPGTPTPEASTTSSPTGAMPSPTAAPAAPAPDAGRAGGPVVRLTGCRNFGGVFPVPMGAARAALPPGFEPVATPSDPAGGATLYVLGVRCAAAAVDGTAVGEATLAYAELAVVPPAEAAVDGVPDSTVPLAFAATPQAVGDAFAAFRLGQAGFGEVTWAEHTGAGDVVVAATLGDVSFTLRGATTPEPPANLGSGDFVLYGAQEGALWTRVLGSAAGGEAVDAAVALEATGLPLLAEARPVVRGFSVSGFDLEFRLVPTPVETPRPAT